MATNSTNVNFYRGDSFSSYEPGAIYFEESTHCIKVATSSTAADVYSGVQRASIDDEGTLIIVNEEGDTLSVEIGKILGDINTILESIIND